MKINNVSFKQNLSINNRINFKAKDDIEHFEGCLFGGAIGDAFGRIVEFAPIEKIKETFGSAGLQYIPKSEGKYKVTDDTQMTLFTAEGLLRSFLNSGDLTHEPNYNDIYESYKRWYMTQTVPFQESTDNRGLTSERDLYVQRGPGNTCLSALEQGIPGSIDKKINNSAGNGGVMRVAPIGLMYHKNPELAFEVGAKTAALTHSNPNGYLPAGFLSALIANIINDKTIQQSVISSKDILKNYKDNIDTLDSIEKAERLAKKESLIPEDAIAQIGEGKKGNDALGIALYCVLKSPEKFKKAIAMAVNHSGDSDTTAAITGNIIGAFNGINSINKGFVNNIELYDWLCGMSKHLHITEDDIRVAQKCIKGSQELLEKNSEDRFS